MLRRDVHMRIQQASGLVHVHTSQRGSSEHVLESNFS